MRLKAAILSPSAAFLCWLWKRSSLFAAISCLAWLKIASVYSRPNRKHASQQMSDRPETKYVFSCVAVSHYTKNFENLVIKEECLERDVLVLENWAAVDFTSLGWCLRYASRVKLCCIFIDKEIRISVNKVKKKKKVWLAHCLFQFLAS